MIFGPEVSTRDWIGNSHQIKVLSTPRRRSFCHFFLQRAFLQTRCGYYCVDTACARCSELFSCVGRSCEEKGGLGWVVYIFAKQTLSLCICFMPSCPPTARQPPPVGAECAAASARSDRRGLALPDWIQLLWKCSEGARQFALLNNL